MAGTGPKAPILAWLGIEFDDAWGSHSLADGTGLPPSLFAWTETQVARLGQRARDGGDDDPRRLGATARAVLLRPPGPSSTARRPRSEADGGESGDRFWVHLALVGPDGARRWRRRVDGLGRLDELELLDLLATPPLDDPRPLVFVCAHHERDRCCAAGLPVARALARSGVAEVWACSHLGGHRYAPTLVVLPAGELYGRIEPSDVPTLVEHLEEGRTWLDRLRGRVDLPPVAQAADVALRRHWLESAAGQGPECLPRLLRAPRATPEPGTVATVDFDSPRGRFRVKLETRLAQAEVLASCGPPERLVGRPDQRWTAGRSAAPPRTRPLRFSPTAIEGLDDGSRPAE